MATPEITTALLTLAGALVGALPGLISGFFSRRAEEKKQMTHQLELAGRFVTHVSRLLVR
jgi:hypothetical protein